MKKTITTILLIIYSIISYGQNITLNDLLTMYKKVDWGEVNVFLNNKGWKYYESNKESFNEYAKITWSFNKKDYNDKAPGWILLYLDGSLFKGITFQTTSNKIQNNILVQAKSLGFYKTGNEIKEDVLIQEYSNKKYILRFYIQKSKNDEYFQESKIIYFVEIEKIREQKLTQAESKALYEAIMDKLNQKKDNQPIDNEDSNNNSIDDSETDKHDCSIENAISNHYIIGTWKDFNSTMTFNSDNSFSIIWDVDNTKDTGSWKFYEELEVLRIKIKENENIYFHFGEFCKNIFTYKSGGELAEYVEARRIK